MPNLKLDPRCLSPERNTKRRGFTTPEKEAILLRHYQAKLKQLGSTDRELSEIYEEKIDALKFHDLEDMRRYGVIADLKSLPKTQ